MKDWSSEVLTQPKQVRLTLYRKRFQTIKNLIRQREKKNIPLHQRCFCCSVSAAKKALREDAREAIASVRSRMKQMYGLD